MKWVREIQPRAGRNFFAVLFAAGAVNFGVFLMVRFSLRIVCDASDAKREWRRERRERVVVVFLCGEREAVVFLFAENVLPHG